MSWAKIDDQFHCHPKVEALEIDTTLAAVGLYFLALSWSAATLTEGKIPRHKVVRFSGSATGYALAEELVRVGLWEATEDGYQIHDYLEYNPPREYALKHKDELSQMRSRAGQKGAEARWHSKDGKPIANTMANDWQNDAPVPVPVPVPITRSSKRQNLASAIADTRAFDSFWETYPVKTGKGAARTAWNKALKKADAATILAGLASHLPAWAEQEQRFIPAPKKWLEEERWDDTPTNGNGVDPARERRERLASARDMLEFRGEDAARRYLRGHDDLITELFGGTHV